MSHANARLTPAGRLLLVQRVAAGEPQAEAARQMVLSRGTVAKWLRRWVEHGDCGLADRSSRPRRSPRRTAARTEERICRLRRTTKRGPVYLSARTGVPASTVWRVLRRHGLNRLDVIDRPTGRVIRRYERSAPGELVHLDIKKVAKIPPGGGWRAHGRQSPQARRSRRSRGSGYTYLHVAVDDYCESPTSRPATTRPPIRVHKRQRRARCRCGMSDAVQVTKRSCVVKTWVCAQRKLTPSRCRGTTALIPACACRSRRFVAYGLVSIFG